ncbi:hypothetical protein SEA_ABIGAIL_40 [Microbacterium phage Abigail]|uniref:hypothetical protein n=1 Tax=Microbacterium phage Abigail TaxID=2851101 RepID=UPI001C77461C|nr:hypothetical protein QDW37_gp40 [Microbacterium phage Abigail]QXN73540.1 hypothetical protein SEA_ABIGAIL_40 [Microbacterium phage Abigail]WIC89530.1 hypothetical protein SEA_LIMABEAN_40 [Microbacterium phage LimaBean]
MNNNENANETTVNYFTNRRSAERFARAHGGPITIVIEHTARGDWKVTISSK